MQGMPLKRNASTLNLQSVLLREREREREREEGLSDHEKLPVLRTFLSVGAVKIEVMDH
jgi:hypothetical protein